MRKLDLVFGVPRTGLSGVYNVLDHYEHEQQRGVEYVSTMHKAMHGVEHFPYYSPTHLLKKLSTDELNRWEAGTASIFRTFDLGLFTWQLQYKRLRWVFVSLLFPEFLRSLCFTERVTSWFRWNPPQSSPSSSPRCLWRCRSTCFLKSATALSSLTSCCQTGASTSPSSAASSRSSGNFREPSESDSVIIFNPYYWRLFIKCEQT